MDTIYAVLVFFDYEGCIGLTLHTSLEAAECKLESLVGSYSYGDIWDTIEIRGPIAAGEDVMSAKLVKFRSR